MEGSNSHAASAVRQDGTHNGRAERALARVGQELGTGHVWAMRRVADEETFHVVAAHGLGLVPGGTVLPLAACDLANAALRGRSASVELSPSGAPLEALACAIGLRAATALPLQRDDGTTVGGILAAWAGPPPSTDTTERAVRRQRDALLTLMGPIAGSTRHVAVAHGDPLVAHGVAGVLTQSLPVRVHLCESVDDLVELAGTHGVDAIACDEGLGGEPLTDIAYRLRASGAAVPLIAVAGTRTSASVSGALRAGVAGYLTLDEAADDVVAAVSTVLDGGLHLPAAPAATPAPDLTHRETEVLRGFERGLSDYAISRELQVSLSTVKTHARRLFRKLEVGSRTAAVHRARTEGLLR